MNSHKFDGCVLNKEYNYNYQSIDYEKIQDKESIVTIETNKYNSRILHINSTPSFSPKQQDCIAQVVEVARYYNRKIIIEIPQKQQGK